MLFIIGHGAVVTSCAPALLRIKFHAAMQAVTIANGGGSHAAQGVCIFMSILHAVFMDWFSSCVVQK